MKWDKTQIRLFDTNFISFLFLFILFFFLAPVLVAYTPLKGWGGREGGGGGGGGGGVQIILSDKRS